MILLQPVYLVFQLLDYLPQRIDLLLTLIALELAPEILILLPGLIELSLRLLSGLVCDDFGELLLLQEGFVQRLLDLDVVVHCFDDLKELALLHLPREFEQSFE